MAVAGIGLGSNLGDSIANLQSARDYLALLSLNERVLNQASLYQSSPVDCPAGSPDFVNTALEICYNGSPESLLAETQKLETLLGRKPKTEHNEARLVDIDILYFDQCVLHTTTLELPHPRVHLRKFVLQPLQDICPNRILPNQTLTISELLERLNTSSEPPLKHLQSHW